MMDELKQQFYEVMHKYQKPFSEEGVTAKVLFRCERGPFVKWCKYITWLEFGAVSCQSCKADVKFMATRCANAESYGMLTI